MNVNYTLNLHNCESSCCLTIARLINLGKEANQGAKFEIYKALPMSEVTQLLIFLFVH